MSKRGLWEIPDSQGRGELEDLLDLYMRELGPLFGLQPDADGRFRYASLANFWSLPGHHVLVLAGGRGFALVRQGSRLRVTSNCWDLAEFFVLPEWRGQGLAQQAAAELWALFPGDWEVRVLIANLPALRFWTRCLAQQRELAPAAESYRLDERDWQVFRFRS